MFQKEVPCAAFPKKGKPDGVLPLPRENAPQGTSELFARDTGLPVSLKNAVQQCSMMVGENYEQADAAVQRIRQQLRTVTARTACTERLVEKGVIGQPSSRGRLITTMFIIIVMLSAVVKRKKRKLGT